ncbi:MAG: hypothetical protein IPK76_06710 [Lewinellaceae bacterium]|nr:hypothetical protein [Lewinellaceae bacterium]
MAHRQDYMSQDGVTGLMIGLALIKKYIPENAEVTTCDGATFRPLQMAKTISNAIVNRIDDAHNNRIFFPGSDECCAKKITLSNFEGGHASSIIHGLKKSADYIDDQGRHSNVGEYIAWEGLRALTQATINSNAKFWLRLKTLGWDMGEERPATKTLFNSAIETQNLEILALINNLLYPAGDNLETDQAFFADLLCKAPCGGPCQKGQILERLIQRYGQNLNAQITLNGWECVGKPMDSEEIAYSTAWITWHCITFTCFITASL